ncbi:MAG: hypothetical protein KAX38_06915 [Candidatus Krumholzibacteria bacterium]|nr:hypothetical protein [Candidatus Krumholzibacteria bacterium]
MLVKCSLCGGENKIHPGQKMLFCSYCGSALAVEGKEEPEHLILPHKRNDRNAVEALRSFLLFKDSGQLKDVKIDFSYVPFLMTEDEKGQVRTIAAHKQFAVLDALPHPPAGDYRFFDESLADKEKVLPVEKIDDDTVKILHLPLYHVSYSSGGSSYEATVIGESWQVLSEELPPERSATLNAANILAAAGLFLIYLFIGKSASNWAGRFGLLLVSSTIGFALYCLREKVVKH